MLVPKTKKNISNPRKTKKKKIFPFFCVVDSHLLSSSGTSREILKIPISSSENKGKELFAHLLVSLDFLVFVAAKHYRPLSGLNVKFMRATAGTELGGQKQDF